MASSNPSADGSLYAVLNVPQNASEDEIRTAYRRLSVLFHPDKHAAGGDEGRQTAEAEFMRVKRAYEVLADRHKRDIYDLYGEKGLEADWEIVPRATSGQELLEMYDRIRRLRQEEYVQKLSKPYGSAVMNVDVRPLIKCFSRNPHTEDEEYDYVDYEGEGDEDDEGFILDNGDVENGDNHLSVADVSDLHEKEYYHTGQPENVSLLAPTKFNVEQQLEVPLSSYDCMTYSCNIQTTEGGRGWGTVGTNFRHCFALEPSRVSATVNAGCQVGHIPQVSAGTYLSLPSVCFVYADVAWRPWAFQSKRILPRVHIGRKFSPNVVGRLEFQQREEDSPSGEQTMRLVVERQSHYGALRVHASLGVDTLPSFGVRYSPKLLSNLTGRLELTGNTVGVRLGTGIEQAVTPLTRLGMKIDLSFPGGVQLTLRFCRGDQRFTIPIVVSDEVSTAAVLYSTILPVTVFFLVRECIVRPYIRHCAAEEARTRSAQLEAELVQKYKDNEAFVQLMSETFQNSVAAEKARRGLVILNGWYGRLVSASDSDEDTGEGGMLDVTVALQCLVKESRLILHDTDKSALPGFFDPAPQQSKSLRVRYEFRGQLHEVTVGNSEPLQLPKQSHTL